MGFFPRLLCAAVIAAFSFHVPVFAQDVTMTSRDGSLSFSGTLRAFDGEFYRVETEFGLLTLDAAGVLCDGPACPNLLAPKAVIKIAGALELGDMFLPPLMSAFAAFRGITLLPRTVGQPYVFVDPKTQKVLAEFSFQALSPADQSDALRVATVDMLLGAVTENGFRARLLALDALVPIVAADNQLPSISTPQLAKVLMGETKNWSEIGGLDMPIVVHGMSQGSDLQTTLSARLGTDFTASVVHPNLAELAAAVAKDPWAIAMIGSTVVGNARKLPLTDSCGFTLSPSSFSVKAEDYPLTFPVFLVTPPRRLGLIAREFLEFVETPQAQKEIETTGYITSAAKEQPMVGDAVRLMNALRFADQDTALGDLKRLAEAMNRSTRLSFTFRFQDGSDQLNAQAKTSLADLARLIDLGVYRHQHLVLAGFSGGFEDKAENLATSRADAMIVLNALNSLLSQSDKTQIPQIDAFGDVLPVACDKTTAGKSLNRRVEVWLQPSLAKAP